MAVHSPQPQAWRRSASGRDAMNASQRGRSVSSARRAMGGTRASLTAPCAGRGDSAAGQFWTTKGTASTPHRTLPFGCHFLALDEDQAMGAIRECRGVDAQRALVPAIGAQDFGARVAVMEVRINRCDEAALRDVGTRRLGRLEPERERRRRGARRSRPMPCPARPGSTSLRSSSPGRRGSSKEEPPMRVLARQLRSALPFSMSTGMFCRTMNRLPFGCFTVQLKDADLE